MESSPEQQQQMSEESPKVWTQLTDGCQAVDQMMADQPVMSGMCPQIPIGSDGQSYDEQSLAMVPYVQPNPSLHCLQSGDGTDYSSIMAVVQSERSQKGYQPSVESRQLHNHKERLRRSRMKCSCDALRALVPGMSDKTDKATVLEHTVAFLFHLSKCEGVKCDVCPLETHFKTDINAFPVQDYVPTYPPPMSAKLLDLYPTLMAGEYRYYESIPSADPNFPNLTGEAINQSNIIEVHESDGKRYVTTSDGSQYMIVDSQEQQMATTYETEQNMETMGVTEQTDDQQMTEDRAVTPKDEPMEPMSDECRNSVNKVLEMLAEDDNKENIDPNRRHSTTTDGTVRKKRAYRKRQKKTDGQPTDADNCPLKTRPQRRLRPKLF